MEKEKENLNYFCMTDCLALVNNLKGFSGTIFGLIWILHSKLAMFLFGLTGKW